MKTVVDGGLIVKDPLDVRVYQFNWDAHLGQGVTIVATTMTVAARRPHGATVPSLTTSGPGLGIQSGSRSVSVLVAGGVLGAVYELTNEITTNETPAQVINRMVRIRVENK